MYFVFHGLDRADAGDLRAATRPSHLEYHSQFAHPVGGPLLDDDGNACGSMIVLDVPDRAAAEALMAGDPYLKVGLFGTWSIQRFHAAAWPVGP